AEEQLARLRALAHPGHAVEYPAQLCAREIGVRHQAGLGAGHLAVAVLNQGVHHLTGAPALPDYGVIDRFAGIFVPDYGSFTLVCDAYARYLRGVGLDLEHGYARDLQRGVPDLLRVVLPPAWLGIILRELLLRHRAYAATVV